jgi:hypothetical protein
VDRLEPAGPDRRDDGRAGGPCRSVLFARERLGFDPDPRQAEVLGTKSRRGILNCTRQWGKSTVTAAKAVHRAWTVPESLVLVVSKKRRQSGLWIRKAATFVQRLGVEPRGDGGRSEDGQYARLEAHGFYWTASESGSASGYFYNFGRGGQALHRQSSGEEKRAFSVRCVRD